MENVLRLTSPMMHGPAVRRLQEIGDRLGFDYGPNDGVFGPVTERVVRAVQRRFHLEEDGVCGAGTWGAVLKAVDEETPPATHAFQGDVPMADRRGLHPRPRLFAHQRQWEDVTGVTLHQTGCAMPENPSGWDRLNAHIGVTRQGTVVLVNDPADMIWHAQGLSLRTIGIEVAGNFCGVEGDERTLWLGGGGPHELTAAQEKALGAVFVWLRDELARHGRVWREVHAHRQSSAGRRGDPGSALWQRVAMPWLRELNAQDGGPKWSVGSGRPIPGEWNPDYPGRY